jgi:hypothetical protein
MTYPKYFLWFLFFLVSVFRINAQQSNPQDGMKIYSLKVSELENLVLQSTRMKNLYSNLKSIYKCSAKFKSSRQKSGFISHISGKIDPFYNIDYKNFFVLHLKDSEPVNKVFNDGKIIVAEEGGRAMPTFHFISNVSKNRNNDILPLMSFKKTISKEGMGSFGSYRTETLIVNMSVDQNLRIYGHLSNSNGDEKFTTPSEIGGCQEHSLDLYYINVFKREYLSVNNRVIRIGKDNKLESPLALYKIINIDIDNAKNLSDINLRIRPFNEYNSDYDQMITAQDLLMMIVHHPSAAAGRVNLGPSSANYDYKDLARNPKNNQRRTFTCSGANSNNGFIPDDLFINEKRVYDYFWQGKLDPREDIPRRPIPKRDGEIFFTSLNNQTVDQGALGAILEIKNVRGEIAKLGSSKKNYIYLDPNVQDNKHSNPRYFQQNSINDCRTIVFPDWSNTIADMSGRSVVYYRAANKQIGTPAMVMFGCTYPKRHIGNTFVGPADHVSFACVAND